MKRQIKLLIFNLLALIFCASVAVSQNNKFDIVADEIYRLSNFKQTKSMELLDSLYLMANNDKENTLLIAQCLYQESLLKWRQETVDTFLTVRIRQQLDKNQLSIQELALLEFTLSISLMTEGKYVEAFPIQLQALEKFQQLHDNLFIARTLNFLGNICSYILLVSLSEYYYSEAVTYISPDCYDYYIIKFNYLTVKHNISQLDSDLDSLYYLLETVEDQKHEELLPAFYLNIGSKLLPTSSEKAIFYFSKIEDLEFDNPKLLAILYANMGTYYIGNEDYYHAFYYFKDAQKIMEKNNNINYLSTLYYYISLIYEYQNQMDSSLLYSRKQNDLIQQLHSNTVAIETYQKYISAYLETSKNELIIAEQTIKLKHRQFVIIIIISGSIVLLILLLVLYLNQEKLRKESKNRELITKLELEEKVLQFEKTQRQLELDKQKEVLDSKIREITSYSLLVSSKNTLLKQIRDLNIQMLNNKENAGISAKKINEIIKSNLNADEEWDNFKLHFEKVHPLFFEKLKQLCNNLTEENLKMCAYIKMGISTKQTSQLLHVAPRSIIINRYRLKKRLKLSDDKNLEDFIISL